MYRCQAEKELFWDEDSSQLLTRMTRLVAVTKQKETNSDGEDLYLQIQSSDEVGTELPPECAFVFSEEM